MICSTTNVIMVQSSSKKTHAEMCQTRSSTVNNEGVSTNKGADFLLYYLQNSLTGYQFIMYPGVQLPLKLYIQGTQ